MVVTSGGHLLSKESYRREEDEEEDEDASSWPRQQLGLPLVHCFRRHDGLDHRKELPQGRCSYGPPRTLILFVVLEAW
jgi:hypothetical protein